MKQLAIFLILCLSISCTQIPKNIEPNKDGIECIRPVPNSQYYIYKFQGCEYIGNINMGPNSIFTHLGNCHNQIHHYAYPNFVGDTSKTSLNTKHKYTQDQIAMAIQEELLAYETRAIINFKF